jgi:hypothetical protein
VADVYAHGEGVRSVVEMVRFLLDALIGGVSLGLLAALTQGRG